MNVFVRKSSCSLLFVYVLPSSTDNQRHKKFKFTSSFLSLSLSLFLSNAYVHLFIQSFVVFVEDRPTCISTNSIQEKKRNEMISVLICCFYAWVQLLCFYISNINLVQWLRKRLQNFRPFVSVDRTNFSSIYSLQIIFMTQSKSKHIKIALIIQCNYDRVSIYQEEEKKSRLNKLRQWLIRDMLEREKKTMKISSDQ